VTDVEDGIGLLSRNERCFVARKGMEGVQEGGRKGTYEANISTVKSVSSCLTSKAN